MNSHSTYTYATGDLLEVRDPGPAVAHALGELVVGELFHQSDGVAGADADGALAGDL